MGTFRIVGTERDAGGEADCGCREGGDEDVFQVAHKKDYINQARITQITRSLCNREIREIRA